MSASETRGDRSFRHVAQAVIGLLGALLLLGPGPLAAVAPADKGAEPGIAIVGNGRRSFPPFDEARKLSGAARLKMLKERGGNARSEAAVALGLRWLALHQASDGHWGLHDFNKHARTEPLPPGKVVPDKSEPGTKRRNDIAGTALGLLPFLAAGITPKSNDKERQQYARTVDAGLKYLLSKQSKAATDRGYFGGDMYAHAQATTAMCEAYGMTDDPVLKASAQLGIDFIVKAQHDGGGWRYLPRTAGDTSVTGWQLMALKSGQMSGLTVPRATLRKVEAFLNSVETSKNSGHYSYTPGGGETYVMTAVGLHCRQWLGTHPRNPGLLAGIRKVRASPPGVTSNIYYEYYATQVLYHLGGEYWKEWNLGRDGDGKGGMRDTLIASQDQGTKVADNKGSWAGNDHVGGRLGATSLSLLTLQVYYRHPRLYQRD